MTIENENSNSENLTGSEPQNEIENQNSTKPNLENEEGEQSPADSGSLASLESDILGEMPEVQEHAIAIEKQKDAEFAAQFSHLVDKDGKSFDPNLHKTKKDGTPSVSKTGKLMLKPASQQKSSTKSSGESTTQNSGQSDNPDAPEGGDLAQSTALGRVSAQTLITVGMMIGGDEWKPQKSAGYDESEALTQAFTDYYMATGKTEISPSMALMLSIGSYIAPRAAMPKTRGRLKNMGAKMFAWFHNRKGAKLERARQSAENHRKSQEKQPA